MNTTSQNPTPSVAHFSFSGDFGGREKVAVGLCRSMRSMGLDCRLFMVVETRAGEQRNGNLMRSLGDIEAFAEIFRTSSRFSFPLLRSVANRLRELHISVVHCHCYKSLYYAELMRMFGLYRGVVVYTLHGLILPKGGMAAMIKSLQRMGLRLADGVIGCSREVLESSLPPRCRGLSTAIINAIELPEPDPSALLSGRDKAREELAARFGLDPSLPVVINVGRLCTQKNYPLYLEMIRRNISENGAALVNYLLVGNGELQANLEDAARRMGIRDNVVFTGFVSDMDAVYRGADLLVQTSIWEGTPMCLLEARSYALPVVAPAVGGNVDVVRSGDDGVLYPVNDLSALREGFHMYMDDSLIRSRHGRRAYERVQSDFGTGEWSRRHLEFYDEVIRDAQPFVEEAT